MSELKPEKNAETDTEPQQVNIILAFDVPLGVRADAEKLLGEAAQLAQEAVRVHVQQRMNWLGVEFLGVRVDWD
jgi:hypothetical protein